YEAKDPNDPHSEPLAVPHGIHPREIRQHLQGVYTAKALKEDWKAFERFVPVRPLPGKKLDEASIRISQLINDKVAAAEKNLFLGKKTCREGHYDGPPLALQKTPPAWDLGKQ